MSDTVDMLTLTSNIEFVHMLEGIFDRGAVHQFGVPSGKVREFTGNVKVGGKEVTDGIVVVFDECQVGDRALITNEPASRVK